MWKLASIRKLLESAVPDFEKNPENLLVLAREGRAITTLAGGLSFEYAYTVEIFIQDYAGHTDALFLPVLAWVRVNQSDLIDNPATQKRGIEFDVDPLTSDTVDICIRIPVTEAAVVKTDDQHATRYIIEHPGEPCHRGRPCLPEHWELWLKDEKLCEWDIPAPPEKTRFDWEL